MRGVRLAVTLRLPRIFGPVVVSSLVIACGGEPPLPPTPPPAPDVPAAPPPPAPRVHETVSSDSARATTEATFRVPAGWTIDADPGRAILTPPEPDLHVAIVDTTAATADDAMAAAWPTVHPGFSRRLHVAEARAARRGWDERELYVYETSPDEKVEVWGMAMRHGRVWTAYLFEGSEATSEKRAGAVAVVGQTLSPKGYERESFAGRKGRPLDAARLDELTDFVKTAAQALDVPGVAIGIVADGKVVLARGVGVKEIAKPEKVDADTLFMIASNTKALTTLLLAEEVDLGKLSWTAPVISVYPEFKLGNTATTTSVEIKHLVCACTGMPREDLPWIYEYARASPASVMQLLGTMQPTSKLGETYQYSNLMAAAAGFVAGHVAFPKEELGKAYDDAMRTKVLGPLGMTSTTFDYARAMRGNHASPHSFGVDDRPAVANDAINHAIYPARPAGAAWSSVNDMLRYVSMELSNGKLPSGATLVSAEALLARREPQVSMGTFTSYGMALRTETEWGVPWIHHGGALVGFKSDMFWIPEAGVGGVILTNGDRGWAMTRPFVRRVFELLYDGQPEAVDDVAVAAQGIKAESAKMRERITLPPAPEVVTKLAARYHDDVLGDVRLTRKADGCVVDVGEWRSPVATRKNDDGTTSLVAVDPGLYPGISFVVGERAGKRVLVVRDAQHEYVFMEQP